MTYEKSRDRELLENIITYKRAGIYAGIDPTAPSLHIGHMLPFMVLAWAYVYGIRAVWLVCCFTLSLFTPPVAAGWMDRLTTCYQRSLVVRQRRLATRQGDR